MGRANFSDCDLPADAAGLIPRSHRYRSGGCARPVHLLLAAAFMLTWNPAYAAKSAPAGQMQLPAPNGAMPAQATEEPDPNPAQAWGKNRSYLIPALDIIGFDTLLNQYNRHFISSKTYGSDPSSIWHNLKRGWHVDNDPYKTNQLLHPYQGSMYHGFARSAGLNYWESWGYTFAGSALWEIAGETTQPSENDQVASGIAGSFLGEALFRMSNLVLEQGHGDIGFWRGLTATAISPATGFNRLAFGDRFDGVFPSHDPAYFGSLQLGSSATTSSQKGPSSKLDHSVAIADFSMDYGLPGKSGYTYERPFDYFHFHVIGATGTGIDNLSTYGLLLGTRYGAGDSYRGIWGIYANYDYLAPRLFRVSSTALSLGTTGQLGTPHSIAVQGSALFGAGYAAAGTLHSTAPSDYHYGIAPQALLALRFILGNRAAFGLSAEEFFVSRLAASSREGRDNIVSADLSFTLRVYHRQAISLKYLWTHRDASLHGQPNVVQEHGTIGLFYTVLTDADFGAVQF